MTKIELIAKVAEKAGLSKKDAERAINAVLSSVEDALGSGEKVIITGFGAFEVRERGARLGRNPQTGETIEIGPKKLPAFKAGKTLKEACQSA